MIVLLEPVCHEWMHEGGNAGLLRQIYETTDEEIMYIAEEKHIECVFKIYPNSNIRYKKLKGIKIGEELHQYHNVWYYYSVLLEIWRKYHPTSIFVTCAYRPGILAAELFSIWNKKAKIHVLLHGMVEKGKTNSDSYPRLLQLSRYCSKLDFMTYSPYCTAEYWNINQNKMIFIHRPCIKADKHKVEKEGNKTVIGIIGACANRSALNLIKTINRMGIGQECEFWVASRFGKDFKGIPNVKVYLSFERKNMEKLIQQMDYMLLPYGKGEYKISASGVLWDAVSNEIPCFLLDSNYFNYYMPYNIGYQAKSIKELCDVIASKISDSEHMHYFTGIEELEAYNKQILRTMLK